MPIEHSPKNPGTQDENGSDFLGFEDETVDPVTAARLKSLTRQREQVKNKLLRIYGIVNDHGAIDLAQLKVYRNSLQSIYSEFSSFHSQIVAIVPDNLMNAQEDEYLRFEEFFHWTSASIETRIQQQPIINPTPPAQVVIHQQPLKAPIPTFDGEYAKWPKFKAMFQGIMAQSRDPNSIKLYHLDKALVGAAAGVLDAKTINEGNYNQAWRILTERYENQRVIVETHIRGLLTLTKMTNESSKELRSLIDECSNHVESLQYLAQEMTGMSELMVVYLLTAALDKSTRKLWEQSLQPGELPKYAPTIAFLKSQCLVLERCETSFPAAAKPTAKVSQVTKQTTPTTKQPVATQRSHAATTKNDETQKCDFCGATHRNYQCNTLNKLSHAEKTEKVRSAGICFNCLRKGHLSKNCPSTKTCFKCQKRHHTQLHDEETKPKQDSKTTVPTETPKPDSSAESKPAALQQPAGSAVTTTCSYSTSSTPKTVLLLTAVVLVTDSNKITHNCRALLDCGSQANFITESMATTLGVQRKPANVPISGINNVKSTARDKVTVQFKSRCSDYRATMECLVTPKVTGSIPTKNIDTSDWVIPDGVQLADPTFFRSSKIDMLIGAELFFTLLKPGHIKIEDDLPELRNSHLGWLVAGSVPPKQDESLQYAHVASLETIDDAINKFWQLEEVPTASKVSPEEQRCEEHFNFTYTRDHTGRFQVRLPFKPNVNQMDSCRSIALKRFYMLENRLQRNPELKTQYVDFIREYLHLGHCREVNENSDDPDKKPYYMPHHAVLRPGSSTTKCRVVFDASAKSSPTNLSLNDILLVGPVVQSDILTITIRFRQHRYVFTADITKMYRQIRIHPDDTHKQRIFWRENPSDPLKVLELLTVTYGTASAPYQATRSLVQLADDEHEKFSVAARIIKDDCYVDDVLSGTATIDEAITAHRQLKEMLAKGGFPIHKWCSNSQQLLDCIPEAEKEPLKPLEDRHVNSVIKVLGLLWEPTSDELLIAGCTKPTTRTEKPETKRTIYSEVAKLFDPLGVFAPSILMAKLLVQQLWLHKLDWDEPVGKEYQESWTKLKKALPDLLNIKIPRQVTSNGAIHYELHAFADASMLAYGACIYVKSIMPDGTAKARLLTSKSKVAPLSFLSIPRKELCGSLLVTRLLIKVLSALTIPISKTVLYSDSQIVLAWLKKHPYELETFIGNRVAEIKANTEGYTWEYVRSQQNPADIVSRGLLPNELRDSELWWNGPEFINSSAIYSEKAEEIPDDILPELKTSIVVTTTLITEQLSIFEKYSSFRKLQRVVAWILRFKSNALTRGISELLIDTSR